MAPRRIVLERPLEVGRGGDGLVVADDRVSRRHLRLVPSPIALSVVDLGSRNGTTVNGVPLTGRATLAAGDVVRFGGTEIVILHVPTVEPDGDLGGTTLAPASAAAPPPPGPAPVRPVWLTTAERVLGIDPTGTRNLFPSFTDLPSRIPLRLWQIARLVSVVAYLAVVVALFVRPAGGLFVFFGIVVPLLPGLFLIAPGLWRNICPLAATNQVPRLFGFTLAKNPPEWLYSRGYLVAITLFFGIAGARLAGLDRVGPAAGVALAGVATAAFTGGFVYKGKSGWCSTVCPLFPLQRAYGQTPFVTVANNHCQPCVGCAKNCFDFRPRSAYQLDLTDTDRGWSAPRKLFVAALPGFVLGFFTLTGQTGTALPQRYAVLALIMLTAVGLFFAVEAMTAISASLLTSGYAAMALNIFYWFAGVTLAKSFATVTGVGAPWLRWPISVFVLLATLVWLARTRVVELQHAHASGTRTAPVVLPFPRVRSTPAAEPGLSVVFQPGGSRVAADVGMSLLDVAEQAGQPVEAGCRMGVCGADPVAVLEGMPCLTAIGADEKNTLQRLGFADNTRMACCARIERGTVTVGLTPEPGREVTTARGRADRSIVSVVVLGNGIAGVTAADFVRRGHPDCEIHLVGREPHDFYNRMGISRLVYGRSAMQGLSLLPATWYDEHQVTTWLNTLATGIDPVGRRVHLGTGDVLPYDRLIVATGADSTRPEVDGFGCPGTFVLREAHDAMALRAYVQQHRCGRAVVAGGGLLGLEAAYALRQLGLAVTVLERGKRLLSKQLDPRASELVHAHFRAHGIEVLIGAETRSVLGDPAVRAVELRDGRRLGTDIFLAAIGIRPRADLARRAGIPVGKGILVDDRMATAIPGVYAAGDVAEHAGRVLGLWPIAADQARIAAVNALGGDETLPVENPAAILKGVGLELFSIGTVQPGPGDEEIVVDHGAAFSYRRLVISRGRAVGATVLGHHPADHAAALQAVRTETVVAPALLPALRAGDWSGLATAAT
ncbi:FAD-dependent oxidoreductase [Nocardia stercoris]|nr:FAD-dependent oxidoreductase [Nocardia stercoris]